MQVRTDGRDSNDGKRDAFIAFGWASYWQGDTTERDGEREGGVDGIGASLRPEERHRMRLVGPGSP